MAVVREDVVKVTYDVDSKPLDKVDDSIDQLVKSTQQMAGDSGVGKLTSGFQSLANSAKAFAKTKIDTVKASIDKFTTSLTGGEKGAKGLLNSVKNIAKAGFSKVISGVKSLATGLGKALTTAGKLALKLGGMALKGLTVGLGAAVAGLTALGTQAIKAYADFEQLKGGVETLFGAGGMSISEYAKANGKNISDIAGEWYSLERAQNTVFTNANNAYKEAGMSANQYMETVTSFSASLIQSMGGDTEAAAAKAHTAIVDMADNANKMGTSIDLIQNAYSGFAKQNYTMLDNLKLGYGGTKEEMQRLLKDAGKLAGTKFDISSYADVVEAIHVIQENMGIAGTTAKEAEHTLQGSLSSMKGAWQNFLAGLANEDADIDQLVGNLVDSVVTFGKNLIPRINIMLPRLVDGLTQLAHSAVAELPGVVSDILPTLIDSAINLMNSLVSFMQSNSHMLTQLAIDLVMKFATFLLQSLPQIIVVGIEILTALITGIAQQIPQLIPLAIQAILTITNSLTQNLPTILGAGIQILFALCQGLIQALPQLIMAGLQLIFSLVQFIFQNLPTIIQTGIQLVLALIQGIVSSIPQIVAMTFQLIDTIIQSLFSINWLEVGWQLIEGILNGVWEGAKSLVSGVWSGIKGLFSDSGEQAGTATGNSLTSGLQTSSAAATVELSDFATSTTQYGELAATNMASGLSTNAIQITTAASTTMTDTTNVVQTGMDDITMAIGRTDLKPSGVSLMRGLNVGMKSQIPALVETAKQAAQAIKRATDVELDIHSPSRVMEESGMNAGLGQIKGLRNMIPEMQVAAREVSNASIPYDTYSPESSSSYYNSNENSYTTVAPVFNLTISGSQDDRAMARRVKRYVAEAISETFESLERKSYNLREV